MNQLKSRKKIRIKNYDYSNDGAYFVTVCSKDRENIFSKINLSVGAPLACARIELSIIGQIIDNQWNDIVNQYDHIELD